MVIYLIDEASQLTNKAQEDKEERPPKAIAECFADRRTS